MIEGARRLSRQHVSIRVPWHDRRWDGHVCDDPASNTSCVVLSRIAKACRADRSLAGLEFETLKQKDLPPCVEERAGFLSAQDITLRKQHPYKEMSEATHGHFGLTPLRLEPYSAACVPFGWMLRQAVEGDPKKRLKGKAEALRLGYDPAREPDLPFETSWIQDRDNQVVMLDTFFGALKPEDSLCFFYAKRTPLSEDSRRVIVGVGRVTGVGNLVDYNYERPGSLKGVLWERSIRHSLRPQSNDGFLMPYHDLLRAAARDPTLDLEACVAFAPDDQFASYSYATEHLTDDEAIASLLACVVSLKAATERVEVDLSASLSWIDRELARLWRARGVHPGLGSALAAFGLPHGGLLAHEIVRVGAKEGIPFDAFAFLDAFVANPALLPSADGLGFGKSFREKWQLLPPNRKHLLDLVARCAFTEEQAIGAYQPEERTLHPATSDADILANPYLLFERDEASPDRTGFALIDRGVFPPEAIRNARPLPVTAAMADGIDPRRVRGLVTDLLETAAAQNGHTLLPCSWIARLSRTTLLDPPCHLDEDVLAINEARLAETLAETATETGVKAYKLGRYRDAASLISREIRKRVVAKPHDLKHPWRELVDKALGPDRGTTEAEKVEEARARSEKETALQRIAAGRLTILVGPAGSGKTTLLQILCDLPEVSSRGVLLLAPTGKARVRLEEATGRLGQGKTLAQFLSRLQRYDGISGRYYISPQEPREKNYRTVVVDECSMLTEDQLAALLDAIEGVERLVLVGDPRQLPPIGAGRPFVDICRHLAPPESPPVFPRVTPGYAELTMIGRQRGPGRGDVLLARQFSGEALDAGADEVWDRLKTGSLDHVRTAHWPGLPTIEPILTAELVKGLGLSGPDDENGFGLSIGGSAHEGRVFYWPKRPGRDNRGAASASHDWQVLSPVRASLAGVDALNLAIQRGFRAATRDYAAGNGWGIKIPRPAGPQGLLYGDKVINIRNNGRRRTYPKLDAAYVANGDIGVVVGGYKFKGMKSRPKHLEVEFNTQPGVQFTYPRWEFSGDDGSPDLELAYALTVHKTQGSQFAKTFVVVPKDCRPLTRELLYTALTRHRTEVTILHQDDISSLRRYSHPAASEIARRLTDLFTRPDPIDVPFAGTKVTVDRQLLHRTSRGELVQSKSELAIAEKLIAMDVTYIYEQPLVLDGRTRWPDFTIQDDATGITYYWEHLGMLSDPNYAARWKRKREAYLKEGVKPLAEAEGADRILIETMEETGVGLDMLEIERLARVVLG